MNIASILMQTNQRAQELQPEEKRTQFSFTKDKSSSGLENEQ